MKNCCIKNSKIETFKYCPECGKYLKNYDNQKIPITVETIDGVIGNYVESHPSFGQISISKRTCNKNYKLYGSSTSTNNIISIKISSSEKIYDNYCENYFPRDLILELEMTPAQFSELITNVNAGNGIPITISNLMGKNIENADNVLINERIENQISETFNKLKNKINSKFEKINTLLNSKSPLKSSEKDELKTLYNNFLQEIGSNLPFLLKCINESVDYSVSHAKIEIDAFRTHIITQLGFKKLEELQNLQIE